MTRTFGIVANKRKPGIGELVSGMASWLSGRGIKAVLWDDLSDIISEGEFTPLGELARTSDIVVALGGDGTLLRAARAVEDRMIPVLGVNVGSLGFLTEVTVSETYEAFEEILAGRYKCEDRMNVDAEVWRDGERVDKFTALNDMVINKGALSRVIEIKTSVDCDYLATYTADGLIVSTPTGSTAYSLSAGGPIVNPSMEAIIATPICPHTLAVRPMILAPDQELGVELWAGNSQHGEPEVKLTVDGQVGYDVLSGDKITFTKSTQRTRLILSGYRSFYEVLRQKLKWGDDTRRKYGPRTCD
jgi:NAD+ kinase